MSELLLRLQHQFMRVRDRERARTRHVAGTMKRKYTCQENKAAEGVFQGLFLCYCGCGVECQNGNSWRLKQVSRSHMTSLSIHENHQHHQYCPKLWYSHLSIMGFSDFRSIGFIVFSFFSLFEYDLFFILL